MIKRLFYVVAISLMFGQNGFSRILVDQKQKNISPSNSLKVPKAAFYRELTLKVRDRAEFLIPFPGNQSNINYFLEIGSPLYKVPIVSNVQIYNRGPYFYRTFWDRVLLKDGSYLEVNGEKLPLTCIFIDGQDNRFSDPKALDSPLFPDLLLKVYLVVNDFSCQGPLRPGWPENGGREENWDTYLYYEIKDPTIMLPTEAKLRYRWNEYHIVLTDRGEK